MNVNLTSVPTLNPEYWEFAKQYLSGRDKKLADLIKKYKGQKLTSRGSAFFSLARAIVGQQISVKAADSVWKKLEGVIGGEVLPEQVVAKTQEQLRGAGLSRQKASYLRELALFFVNNPNNEWHLKNDEDVIETLVSIKGIGKWSAEMFLIFHLLRPDVFPIADLGLQKAMYKLYYRGKKTPLTKLKKRAEKWKPYRTVATWYLWRSLDPVAVEY